MKTNTLAKLTYWTLLGATVFAVPLMAYAAVSNICTVVNILLRLRNIVSYLVGVIAVVILLYSGFLFLTAGGSEDNLGKAKKYLLYGLIGVGVALLAYSAIPIVNNLLGGGLGLEGTCPE